jgi:hypothetical protein
MTISEAIKACRDMAHTLRTNQTVRMPTPEEWESFAALLESLDEQIRKMRCCGNCHIYDICMVEVQEECMASNYSRWQWEG